MAKNKQEEEALKRKPTPIKQALRQAGEGGITKQELKQITKDSGKSAGTVIQKLDKVNSNLKANDKTGISLNSGAANMLIRQAEKAQSSPINQYMSKLGITPFGDGRIGSVLQARASGTDVLGKQGNLMIGGTAIRPGGREAIQGFGKQYEYGGGAGKGPYQGMTMPEFDPNGPGPLAKPNTNTWLGSQPTTTTPTTTTTTPTTVTEPMTPEDMQAASTAGGPGMLSGGGMGSAGANKLSRASGRLRKLGIYGRGTSLLGRGLQYGNALN